MNLQLIDKTIKRILFYTPFYLLAISIIIPYYWMITTTFKSIDELQENPPTFIPTTPVFDSFYDPLEHQGSHQSGLFQRFPNAPFGFATAIINSIFISATITVISLLIASITAYVLAKHNIPGREMIFFILLFSTLIPPQALITPNFITMKSLNWINTYYAYIIPALPKVFAVFLLRQHLSMFPNEILDSARIDGASELRIWWQIVMPMLRPVLASLAALIILTEWNNFLWPLVIVQSESMLTVPLAIAHIGSTSAKTTITMATALLSSLPTIITFLLFRKYFMERIRATTYYR